MQRFHDRLRNLPGLDDPQAKSESQLLLRWLETGDESSLNAGAALKTPWVVAYMVHDLNAPSQLDDYDRRLLRYAVVSNQTERLNTWPALFDDQPGAFGRWTDALREAGASDEQVDALVVARAMDAVEPNGTPTVIGEYLLSLNPQRLHSALAGRWRLHDARLLAGLARLFHANSQRLFDALFSIAKIELGEEELLIDLLDVLGTAIEPQAAAYFRNIPDTFSLGIRLLDLDHERYAPEVVARLDDHLQHTRWGINIILPKLGPLAVDAMVKHLMQEDAVAYGREDVRDPVQQIAEHGKEKARNGLLKLATSAASGIVAAAAIEELIKLGDPTLTETLEAAIEKGMEGDARDAARFASLAASFAGGRLRDRLWTDLAGKRKLLREAAASALAAGDPDAFAHAKKLLDDKSKDVRLGASTVLAKLKNPAATESLLRHLPTEEVEAIRDEISRALREAGVGMDAILAAMGPVDPEALATKAAAVKTLPVKWIGMDDLPAMQTNDGHPPDPALVRYLLHRQSKQKEPIVDFEAAPIYAMIDRRTSGDFAWSLLNAFLEADAPKTDTWAMITAAALGDHRVTTTLATKVRGWAQDFAQKLGTWGVEALAVNASDPALMALESIATKFKDNPRRKFKVIGEAAQAAIELAAMRLGISMDELGDRVVPTLGFEPSKPRRIEAGKKIIDATIGMDFKLSLVDVATGKRAASVPKAAGPDLVAEFKGLGKLLVEIGKSQAQRLEQLMVRQRRWSGEQWQALFLRHPVLLPFAVRLVWGVFDEEGRLLSAFRALPDGSLTDESDEPRDPPTGGAQVGIVHPLDLSPDAIDAWHTHLSDYEIEQPFPQLGRPVIRLADDLRDQQQYDVLKDAKVNGFAFRAKAEKSGWVRASVGDGGEIDAYRKRFAQSRIDAFVHISGLYFYGDPGAEVTVGSIFFLPVDADDVTRQRIKLADVPAMVFSESIGDMTRIAGRSSETDVAQAETTSSSR